MGVESIGRDPASAAASAERRGFAESLSGRRFGPYTVVRPLVADLPAPLLLGVRIDREDRPKVLLKVFPRSPDAQRIVARFRENPRIFEGLDERALVPILAVDMLDDGLLCVALQHFEAQEPIEAYCNHRKFSTSARVELFTQVCDAVHACHRRFLPVRDFHPETIFVTPEGHVKLPAITLERILEGTSEAALPVTPMTPPEALTNSAPSAAGDIYSLGALLYRLLTSHSPFEEQSESAEELSKAIVETEPPPASAAAVLPIPGAPASSANPAFLRMEGNRSEDLAYSLKGEMDAILRTAMDKDPAKRYGSADQLAADLHRYVRNEAVSVFAGSQLRALKMLLFRYRAASAVLLAVFGGLAFAAVMLGSYTLYAARRARVAESQYADIRQIAHFLFRFDEGSLSSLGQTQRMAVAPTLEALDRLAGRAGSDLALMRELAEAYVRVGDFQTTAYVLDPRGAEASYRKALALAEHVTTQEPLNTPQKAATARINVKLGDLLYNQGQFAEAAGKYGNALDAYEKVASRERAARQGRRNILATLEKVGHARLQAGEFQLASETYSRFMLFARSWLMEEADNLEAQATIAYGMERAAYVLVKSGKAAAGEAGISDAAAAYQKLLLADPTPQLRRAAANCYTILGDTRKDLGRKPQAAESYRQARRILEQLWTEDQQSIQAQRDLAGVEVRLAAVLVESGQAAEAGSLVTRALRLLRPRAESILASPGEMLHFARLLLTAPVVELRDPAAALAIAQRAVESSAVHDPRALQVLASAYAARGENEKAIEAQRKAISALPDRSATPLRKELEAGLVKLVNPNAR